MARVRCYSCRRFVDKSPDLRRWGLSWLCGDCETPGQTARTRRPINRSNISSQSGPSAETRQRVLARDGGRCRLCGLCRAGLHVHHIRYRSEGVDHQAHNLILLCPECHHRVHSDKKRWKPLCLAYVWLRTVEGRSLTLPEIERMIAQ